MRIFLICQQSLQRHDVPAYAFWENYFKAGILEAGHTWVEATHTDWAEGLLTLEREERARWSERTWSRTLAAIKTEHAREPLAFVLSYLFPSQVEPSAVAEIRALGIPCVNFFCDNVREFTRVPESYRSFDLHWVPEYEALPLYRTAAMPFIQAPMPVWVPPEFRTAPTHESQDIIFAGSHDVLREALLASAVQRGLSLRIYGAGWKHNIRTSETRRAASAIDQDRRGFFRNQREFLRKEGLRGFAMKLSYKLHRRPDPEVLKPYLHPAAEGEAYFQTTTTAAVTLGINRYPSFRHSFQRPHSYSRLRDIEAPMLGACYLTEACPGLDQLYEIGSEIEVYHTIDELVAKAKELQTDSRRRQMLRKNGQLRALADHSISRSLEKIVRKLGL
jgi:hypothetical protein